MSDENKDKIIQEYETKKAYYDGLRDDVTNLEKAINDMKNTIKNTVDMQNRIKHDNYTIWSSLENKEVCSNKPTEKKQATIADILESFK